MNGKKIDKADAKYLLLYLLKHFNEVCESAGIIYYASAGTCLGAIRHKGLIPWDDDIDCMMPRKYYDLFISTCKKMLPPELILHTREEDPYFLCEYIKLCFKDDETEYSDISLDVFFLDETNPKRTFFRAMQNRVHLNLYYLKTFKISRMKAGEAKYRPRNPFKYALLKFFSFVPLHTIDSLMNKVMFAEKRESTHYINWGSCHPYKKATYSKEVLGKAQKLPFENQYVWVAEHPEIILSQLFTKNYMTPPPLEKRVGHGNRPLVNSRINMAAIREEIDNSPAIF